MSRHLTRTLWLLAAMLIALFAADAWAGTTGKLSGRVLSEKKEPLAGVNVRIEGQRLGAVTDDKGEYFIIGVPAGTYSVRMNLMGYRPFVAYNVALSPDFTTQLDATLTTEAVQLGEVHVDASRPLLQRDATGTTRFLSSEQISRLPTRGYQDAAAQQSGVVAFKRQVDRESQNGPTLILRGGRPNETAYFVDGFSQTDPLTGNATTSINNNAIQEVVLLNGGFNAEYGRIMSGVVNVLTREGGEKYSGSLEAVTDGVTHYGDSFLGTRSYGYNLYDASFGGPLVKNRDIGSFYLSGQRRWEGDRNPSGAFDRPLPSNGLAGWTGQGKLTIPVAKNLAFKLGGMMSFDDWREYLNQYRFNLAHAPRYQDANRSLTASLNHTLSSKSYYTLGASYFYTERKRGDGMYFDNIDLYGSTPQADFDTAIPWFWPGTSDPNSPLGHILDSLATLHGGNGHIYDDYMRRQSSYWALKGDYTSQLNPYHQMKAGFEYDRHTLRYYDHYYPVNYANQNDTWDIDRYGFSSDGRSKVDGGLDGARKPVTASLYAQDKYEHAGLVVNAGLRYDYINVNTGALPSEQYPLGTGPTYKDIGSVLEKSLTYSRLSPRVGVGFPVSDRTVLHANWGQFYQQPNLQDLYVSYSFLQYKILKGGYFVGFGNPNLKPEETQAYEVGVAHELSSDAKLDATIYYKDVKDLVEIQAVSSKPQGFASYRNVDFATIKGVDLGLTLKRVNHVQAQVSYSLSYALGTGSVSNSAATEVWQGSPLPKQTAPLDFDQRHKLSVNLDYVLGKGEGVKYRNFRPFEHSSIDVLWNIASGTPYTQSDVYDEVGLAAVSRHALGATNSRYGPWSQTVDVKATRTFKVLDFDLSAYVWILNAFDAQNAVQVFTGTGSPTSTGFLNTADGAAAAANLQAKYGLPLASVYGLAEQTQGSYSNPRMIRFGVRMGF